MKERHIKNYIMTIKNEGVSDHSIARRCSAMRLFLKYLRKQGIMVHNPMEDIKQPQLIKREVQLSEHERMLLAEKMRADARDYLMYLMLVDEKIKVSEITKIQWKDVNEQSSIIYLPKRAVSLKDNTLEQLKIVSEEKNDGPIFKNRHGKPLSVNGAHFILKGYLKQVNREDIRPNDLTKF
ncbi:hypothetical protein CN918_27885 [Priestia megaterium]|nr:hypothetical protein CN918_27885 [Priestia megaterium]